MVERNHNDGGFRFPNRNTQHWDPQHYIMVECNDKEGGGGRFHNRNTRHGTAEL